MAVGQTRATLVDLYRTEGKAELINGRIVEHTATGDQPSQIAGNIYVSLRGYSKTRPGTAYTDNIGYVLAASEWSELPGSAG